MINSSQNQNVLEKQNHLENFSKSGSRKSIRSLPSVSISRQTPRRPFDDVVFVRGDSAEQFTKLFKSRNVVSSQTLRLIAQSNRI